MRLIIVLIFTLSTNIFSQDCVISINHQNELFLSLYNYFELFAKDISPKSIYLSTNNGIIEKDDIGYRITPDKFGYATIFIHKISKRDTLLLYQKQFKVITTEAYTKANYAGFSRGKINKDILLAHNRLFAYVENLDFDLTLPITNYRVIILRDNDLIFTTQHNSNNITDDIKDAFKLTLLGDILYIVDIKAQYLENTGIIMRLNDIVLTIE